MRRKALRSVAAVLAAALWAYAPLFPASLCVASGAMTQEQAAPSAHCAHQHETPSQPARSDCTDPETSCCLSVSPDGVVGAATFELDTTVVSIPCPAIDRADTARLTSVWVAAHDTSPPQKLPPPLFDVLRL